MKNADFSPIQTFTKLLLNGQEFRRGMPRDYANS